MSYSNHGLVSARRQYEINLNRRIQVNLRRRIVQKNQEKRSGNTDWCRLLVSTKASKATVEKKRNSIHICLHAKIYLTTFRPLTNCFLRVVNFNAVWGHFISTTRIITHFRLICVRKLKLQTFELNSDCFDLLQMILICFKMKNERALLRNTLFITKNPRQG